MKSKSHVAGPSLVGRVTPCTPRLPPAGAKFPRPRLPDPLPIKTLIEFPTPTTEFGFKRPTLAQNVVYLHIATLTLKPSTLNLSQC